MRALIILTFLLYANAQLEKFQSEGIVEVLSKAPTLGLTVRLEIYKIPSLSTYVILG